MKKIKRKFVLWLLKGINNGIVFQNNSIGDNNCENKIILEVETLILNGNTFKNATLTFDVDK